MSLGRLLSCNGGYEGIGWGKRAADVEKGALFTCMSRRREASLVDRWPLGWM